MSLGSAAGSLILVLVNSSLDIPLMKCDLSVLCRFCNNGAQTKIKAIAYIKLGPIWPDYSYEVPMPYSDAWWKPIVLDNQSQAILESTGLGFKSFGGWTFNQIALLRVIPTMTFQDAYSDS